MFVVCIHTYEPVILFNETCEYNTDYVYWSSHIGTVYYLPVQMPLTNNCTVI